MSLLFVNLFQKQISSLLFILTILVILSLLSLKLYIILKSKLVLDFLYLSTWIIVAFADYS